MESVTPPDHLMFHTWFTTPTSMQVVTETIDIAPTVKGIISIVTEESQRADYTVIESRMTRTVKKHPRVYKRMKETKTDQKTTEIAKRKIVIIQTFLIQKQNISSAESTVIL